MSLPPFQTLLDRQGGGVHGALVAADADEADARFVDVWIAALRNYPDVGDDDLAGWQEPRGGTRGPAQVTLDALAERATAEGLVDVAYGQADSPFGPLTVAVTERGLVLLAYPEVPLDDALARLAADVSPRVLEVPALLDPIREQLDDYFAGRRRDFDHPVDRRLVRGDFAEAILRATAGLGYGETASYREVAARAGNAKAVRAAGNALGANPVPIVVPCHRVVASGGGLGGYTGGAERKQALLALERSERTLAA